MYRSAGGPVWTTGTSTGVMKSSIKVLDDGLNYWNIYWSNEILYKSAGEPVRTDGTSAGVMELYVKLWEDQFGLL